MDWFPTYGPAFLSKCPDALSQLEDICEGPFIPSVDIRNAQMWMGSRTGPRLAFASAPAPSPKLPPKVHMVSWTRPKTRPQIGGTWNGMWMGLGSPPPPFCSHLFAPQRPLPCIRSTGLDQCAQFRPQFEAMADEDRMQRRALSGMRQMVDSVAGAARQYGSLGRQNCAGTEQREERSLVPVPKEFQSKALISSRKQVRNQFLLSSISVNFEVLSSR